MPSSPTIADFSGESSAAFPDTKSLVGGTFVYPGCSASPPEPDNPLFADFSADNWHITGSVGAYSGFGVYWALQDGYNANGYATYTSGLIDVSAYAGIQFDMAGDPGPLGVITFLMESANQQTPSTDPSRPNCGTCAPAAGPCDVASTASVSGLTPATLQTFRIRWRDLTNTRGPALDVTRVASLSWYFPWTPGATPYPVDVTLANLQFLPLSPGDAGGE